jgi:hypothetical protein
MDKIDRLHGGASSKRSRRLSHDLRMDARRLDHLIALRQQAKTGSARAKAGGLIDVAAVRAKARHQTDK